MALPWLQTHSLCPKVCVVVAVSDVAEHVSCSAARRFLVCLYLVWPGLPASVDQPAAQLVAPVMRTARRFGVEHSLPVPEQHESSLALVPPQASVLHWVPVLLRALASEQVRPAFASCCVGLVVAPAC